MPSVVVNSLPREDGQLSIVEVSEKECVLSNGEVVLLKWAKLRTLCEQLCQDRIALRGIRTWWTPDGNELIEFRRDGEPCSVNSTATTSEVF